MMASPTGSQTTVVRSDPFLRGTLLVQALHRIHEPLSVIRDRSSGDLGVCLESETDRLPPQAERFGRIPALAPQSLGDPAFCRAHGLTSPYIAGEMATGIATADMVIAMARAGMLGFFGAGGLPLPVIERALDRIEQALGPGGLPWGINLIHNLQDPRAEDALVDVLLRRDIRRVCASAFLQLTPAVVRYACTGLRTGADGRIVRRHQLVAKLSRPEIAQRFASPAPTPLLAALVASGGLTADEAALAARVPLAEDITVEADSGGHTDNRPLVALFPTIMRAVREIEQRQGYSTPIRLGAAGGLGTPQSVAAAFGLGAAYVVTGSVNQAALESGLSPQGRSLLAQARIEDVAMAPAADMFELGVKVQVLKRGTLFSVRAQRLYEVYRKHASLEEIAQDERLKLEQEIFRAPLEEIWEQTRAFFTQRDPAEVERAQKDPKHRMALVFRWYLGHGSRWATEGASDRMVDYQVWCGPAMGAFNAWTEGSFLADPAQRTVVAIATSLMEGAAAVTRAHQLRTFGVAVPAEAFDFRPLSPLVTPRRSP